MSSQAPPRINIFRAREMPYVFGLSLAAIAWIVSQSTERLLNQPVLEVDVQEVQSFNNERYQCGNDDKQASDYFRITLTSLAPDTRIDTLTAYIRTQGGGEVKAGRILESAPSWSQTAAPSCEGSILSFDLKGIQPFASVVAEMVITSSDEPVFHFESANVIRIKQAGLETWIARNEIAIYSLLLVILILGVLVYAVRLGRNHEAN